MAVAYDASSGASVPNYYGSPLSWTHTASTGAYVLVAFAGPGYSTPTGATYGGVTMTQLATVQLGGPTTAGVNVATIYGLANVTGGAQTISVSYATGGWVTAVAASYLGVGTVPTPSTTYGGSGGTISESVTATTGGMVVGIFLAGDAFADCTMGTFSGGTNRINQTYSGTPYSSGALSDATATTTFSTVLNAGSWGGFGVVLKASTTQGAATGHGALSASAHPTSQTAPVTGQGTLSATAKATKFVLAAHPAGQGTLSAVATNKGSIVFDAVGAGGTINYVFGGPIAYWSHTIASGAAVVAAIFVQSNTAITPSSLSLAATVGGTFNTGLSPNQYVGGTAMTLIGYVPVYNSIYATNTYQFLAFYILQSAPSGTQAVQFLANTSVSNITGSSVSYTGVVSYGSLESNTGTDSLGNLSETVSDATTGKLIFQAFASSDSQNGGCPGTITSYNQTQRWTYAGGQYSSPVTIGDAAGGGSVSFTATAPSPNGGGWAGAAVVLSSTHAATGALTGHGGLTATAHPSRITLPGVGTLSVTAKATKFVLSAFLTGHGVLAAAAAPKGSITYDATGAGAADDYIYGVTGISWTHTIGTGASIVAAVMASYYNGTATPSSLGISVTVGGTAMTLVGYAPVYQAQYSDTNQQFLAIYISLSPPTGTQTVSFLSSSSGSPTYRMAGNSVSYTGVKGYGSLASNGANSGTSLSQSVTSSIGGLIFQAFGMGAYNGALSAYSQTLRWNNAVNQYGEIFSIGDAFSTGAAVSFTATSPTSDGWEGVALPLLGAFSAAGSQTGHGALSATALPLGGHPVGHGVLSATAVIRFVRSAPLTGQGVLKVKPPLPVTFDASSSGYQVGSSGLSFASWTHTATAGAYVLVAVMGSNTPLPTSVTYGGVPMVMIRGVDYPNNNPPYGASALFGLPNAPGGAQTVVATIAAATYFEAAAVSYINVGAIGPASYVYGSGASLSQTVNIGIAGSLIVQFFGDSDAFTDAAIAPSGGTNRVYDHSAGYVAVSASDAATTTTFTGTGAGGGGWLGWGVVLTSVANSVTGYLTGHGGLSATARATKFVFTAPATGRGVLLGNGPFSGVIKKLNAGQSVNIQVIGDSTCYGYGDSQGGGWATRLGQLLGAYYNVTTYEYTFTGAGGSLGTASSTTSGYYNVPTSGSPTPNRFVAYAATGTNTNTISIFNGGVSATKLVDEMNNILSNDGILASQSISVSNSSGTFGLQGFTLDAVMIYDGYNDISNGFLMTSAQWLATVEYYLAGVNPSSVPSIDYTASFPGLLSYFPNGTPVIFCTQHTGDASQPNGSALNYSYMTAVSSALVGANLPLNPIAQLSTNPSFPNVWVLDTSQALNGYPATADIMYASPHPGPVGYERIANFMARVLAPGVQQYDVVSNGPTVGTGRLAATATQKSTQSIALAGHGALSAIAIPRWRVSGRGTLSAPIRPKISQALSGRGSLSSSIVAPIGVAFDAVGVGFSGLGTPTWSHTAHAGAYVLVFSTNLTVADGPTAFQYGSLPMTQLGSYGLNNNTANGQVTIWGIAGVPGGTSTITATMSSPDYSTSGSVSYVGVQSLSALQEVFGSGTSLSQSLTGALRSIVVQAFGVGSASFSTTSGGNQRYDYGSFYTALTIEDTTSTGATNFAATVSGTSPWAGVGLTLTASPFTSLQVNASGVGALRTTTTIGTTFYINQVGGNRFRGNGALSTPLKAIIPASAAHGNGALAASANKGARSSLHGTGALTTKIAYVAQARGRGTLTATVSIKPGYLTAFDNVGGGLTSAIFSGGGLQTFTHVAAANADVFLVISTNTNTPLGAILYNGSVMTQLGVVSDNSGTAGQLFLYHIFDSAGGSRTVSVSTATGTLSTVISANTVSYTNVVSVGSMSSNAGAGTALTSGAITVSAGQWLLNAFGFCTSAAQLSALSGGTNRYTWSTTSSVTAGLSISDTNIVGSTTITATASTSVPWASIGFFLTGTPTVITTERLSGRGALSVFVGQRVNQPAAPHGSGVLSASTGVPRSGFAFSHGALVATAVAIYFTIHSNSSGHGTLSAATRPVFGDPAAPHGHGGLTATTIPQFRPPAAPHGVGTLVAAAFARIVTNPALHGIGTLSAAAGARGNINPVLRGPGALSAVAQLYQSRQTIALAGHGAITTTTQAIFFPPPPAAQGHGALSATAKATEFVITFGGGLPLTLPFTLGAASLNGPAGVGTLSAAARMYQTHITSSSTGHGGLTVTTSTGIPRPATLGGHGALTVTATAKFSRSSSTAGHGSLSATAAIVKINEAPSLSGQGRLTTALFASNQAFPTLHGNGRLSAVVIAARQEPVSGHGTLSATARIFQLYRTAPKTGVGVLAVTTRAKFSIPASSAGHGALVTTALVSHGNPLVGHGALAGTAQIFQLYRSSFTTGHGQLSGQGKGIQFASPLLTGSGRVGVSLVSKTSSTATTSGRGSLTVMTQPHLAATPPLAGHGGLSVAAHSFSTVLLSRGRGAGALKGTVGRLVVPNATGNGALTALVETQTGPAGNVFLPFFV